MNETARIIAPGIAGVYETVLYGSDLDALEQFYVRVLELRCVERIGTLLRALRVNEHAMLLLFNPEEASAPARDLPRHGATGAGHVAFRIPSGLAEWKVRLANSGIPIEAETTWPAGGRSVYFRDPAGNSIELAEGEAWRA